MYLDDGVFVKRCIDDIVYKYFFREKNMDEKDIINELKNIVEFLSKHTFIDRKVKDYLEKLYSEPINKGYVSINDFNRLYMQI